jgi:hypothetical protein
VLLVAVERKKGAAGREFHTAVLFFFFLFFLCFFFPPLLSHCFSVSSSVSAGVDVVYGGSRRFLGRRREM